MSDANKIQKPKVQPPKNPQTKPKIPPKDQQFKIKPPKPKENKEEVKKELASSEDNVVFINSNINELFATSEVTQSFTNTLQKSIELTVSFPLKPEIQLSKFVITIGNKIIISKVLEKGKAEEKYTDAIASGNTGFLSTFDESSKNYTINVGNVLPKERVILKSVFNQIITSQDMSYEFAFLEHYPCFIYSDNAVQSKKISGKFILNTKSKITRLISPYMDENAKKNITFNANFNEDYTEATIDFEKKIEIENEKKEPIHKPFPSRLKKVFRPGNIRVPGNALIRILIFS